MIHHISFAQITLTNLTKIKNINKLDKPFSPIRKVSFPVFFVFGDYLESAPWGTHLRERSFKCMKQHYLSLKAPSFPKLDF